MKGVRYLFLAGLLLMTVGAVADATAYYVATNGSNSYPGTESQPWATLQYAVDSISNGDTIIVKAGTYAGCRIGSSGTSSAPKTLRAETALAAKLNNKSSSAAHNGIIEIENYSETVTYWVIDGFEVDGINKTYRCIDLRGTNHVTVKNCKVYQSYLTGIFAAFSDYVLVENNTSYSNGEHGIYVNNSADNGTVRGNTVYSNTGCGIHMNGDASMGGDGMMSYWLVEKNTSYLNPSGSGINCDGVHNSKFYNNLVYNNTGSGMSLYAGDGANGSSNNVVYNNTIVMPSNGRWALNIPSGTGTDPYGNKIKNNILYNASSTEGSIVTYSTSISGFESDYNVVIDRFSVNEDSSNISLSTWRTYGWDTHSLISTLSALFVDAGNNNYHLSSTSPARDAGTTLSDVTADKDGVSRPQGSVYDIGCYEYESGVADLVITTTSLPNGTVSTAYSQTVQATGGTTPYSWSIVSGSLPSGLSLGSSSGTISGTPTASGTSNFTVRVTDSQGTPDTDDQALSITIAAGIQDLVITTSSLPGGTQGAAYSQTVQGTGGVTPYSWSIVSGSLPSGLSLGSSSGTISGTPTATGTSNFTVRVTDSQGTPDTDDQALSIAITSGGTQEVTFQEGLSGYTGWSDAWITEDNPTDNFGDMDSAHLQYSTQDRQLHEIDLSSIPSGSTINSATLSIYVYNVTGGTPNVAAYRILKDWAEMQVTYNNRLTGTAWGTPGLLSGTDYNATAVANSGNVSAAGWVTFNVTSVVQGWVSGTYANEGLLLRLTSAGHLYTRMSEYTTDTSQRPKLVVNYTSGGVPDLVITTSSLPGGTQGVAYSQTVQATGGTTPYSWSIVSGSLPSGLSLGSSSGTISGTPTVSGTSNFTVRVTDSQGTPDTDDQALSIAVSPADLVITTSSLPNGTVSTAYSQTVQATGGATPYSWSVVSGSLPAGLSLGSSSGTISGTPTASGTSNFTVRVTDSQGTPDTDDQALSIIVTGGGANSTYEFSASDTESTTTSTSYQNKVSLVFTPSTADTWMIFGFAEYKGSSTSYSTLVRLTVDGTAQADLTVEPNDATDYQTFMTMKVASLSAAQHTINIDYRSENSGATARVRNVRIVAIPKGALEMVSNASDGTSTLTTTLTDYVTLNWTPATAGDYLLIWSGEASANTGYSSQVQAKINGANWDEMFIESKDNSDFYSFMSFAVSGCDTSQQTLAVAAAKESTSSTHEIRRARVAAIRLTGSRFADSADSASDAEATTTSTSFQEKLTKSWDWGNAGNWLILTSCRLAGTSASYSNEGRVQLDDSTVLAQPLREPNDTTDYMQAGCIDVRSLGTGTRRLDIDYRSENSGATAKIRTARLYALPLD